MASNFKDRIVFVLKKYLAEVKVTAGTPRTEATGEDFFFPPDRTRGRERRKKDGDTEAE